MLKQCKKTTDIARSCYNFFRVINIKYMGQLLIQPLWSSPPTKFSDGPVGSPYSDLHGWSSAAAAVFFHRTKRREDLQSPSRVITWLAATRVVCYTRPHAREQRFSVPRVPYNSAVRPRTRRRFTLWLVCRRSRPFSASFNMVRTSHAGHSCLVLDIWLLTISVVKRGLQLVIVY